MIDALRARWHSCICWWERFNDSLNWMTFSRIGTERTCVDAQWHKIEWHKWSESPVLSSTQQQQQQQLREKMQRDIHWQSAGCYWSCSWGVSHRLDYSPVQTDRIPVSEDSIQVSEAPVLPLNSTSSLLHSVNWNSTYPTLFCDVVVLRMKLFCCPTRFRCLNCVRKNCAQKESLTGRNGSRTSNTHCDTRYFTTTGNS